MTSKNTTGHAVVGRNATDDGPYDSVKRNVKLVAIFDNSQRTLIYTTTQPIMESGSKTFR